MRRSSASSTRFESVAVLAAMPEELRAVRNRLRRPRTATHFGFRTWSGDLSGVPTCVTLTGEGADNARRGAEALLSSMPAPDLLVAMGVAGALDPRLRHADLVIAAQVLRQGYPALRIDDRVGETIRRSTAITGWIATVDRIATSVADKRALHRHWTRRMSESDPGPGLVDLESASVAEVAERLGVPWVVLRAVSDTASDSLPEFLDRCRRDDGSIHRGAVLLHALLEPASLPNLLRLGWRTRRCATVLAHALERLLTA